MIRVQISMRMLARWTAIAALATVLTAPAPSHAQNFAGPANKRVDRVGSWAIAVASNLGNGCYMHRVYPNRQSVRLGYDARDDSFYLSFYDARWRRVNLQSRYTIGLTFNRDRRSFAELGGRGSRLGELPGLIVKGLDVAYVRSIAKRRSMELYYRGQRLGVFNLRHTYRALVAMLKCQQRMRADHRRPPPDDVDDPFSGPSPDRGYDPGPYPDHDPGAGVYPPPNNGYGLPAPQTDRAAPKSGGGSLW